MHRVSQANARRRPWAAAAALLAVLASYGLMESPGAGGATAMADQVASGSATASDSSSRKASATPTDALASREASTDESGITFRLDVTSVEVEGDLTTVRFTVTNLSKSDSWYVSNFFGDWGTDGLMLFAGDTHEVYRSVEIDGECLCSDEYEEEGAYPELDDIPAGESREAATSFAAVPEGIETVSVAIPGVGVIAGLPVTRK